MKLKQKMQLLSTIMILSKTVPTSAENALLAVYRPPIFLMLKKLNDQKTKELKGERRNPNDREGYSTTLREVVVDLGVWLGIPYVLGFILFRATCSLDTKTEIKDGIAAIKKSLDHAKGKVETARILLNWTKRTHRADSEWEEYLEKLRSEGLELQQNLTDSGRKHNTIVLLLDLKCLMGSSPIGQKWTIQTDDTKGLTIECGNTELPLASKLVLGKVIEEIFLITFGANGKQYLLERSTSVSLSQQAIPQHPKERIYTMNIQLNPQEHKPSEVKNQLKHQLYTEGDPMQSIAHSACRLKTDIRLVKDKLNISLTGTLDYEDIYWIS